MAQQDNTDVQAQPPAEESQELAGYTALPNLLLQELGGENGSTYSVVLFIARHTLGRQVKIGDAFYRVKEVCLSLDEFRHGRRKRDGSRMADTSGLTNDAAIVRGCRAALAHHLIQVVDTGARGVHIYALADRFWVAAGFTTALKMLADPRVPASLTAYTMIAVGDEQMPLLMSSTDKTSIMEREKAVFPAITSHKTAAVPLQNVSSTAHKIPADPSAQPTQEAARGERKHSRKHRILNIDRTFDTTEVQNETQKESENTNLRLAEERLNTELDLPATSQEFDPALPQPGDNRRSTPRQRVFARLNTPPEAQRPSRTPLPDRQARVSSTGEQLRPPPGQVPPADEEAAEVAARHQRLRSLQRELAHLKKTPSMQLLARQRIPRLEAEIKQLVTALQESA